MNPGPLRQVRLVLGLGVRRWLNRMLAGAAARRSARDAGATVVRPPTARRRAGMGALMLAALAAILIQVVFAMTTFTMRSEAAAEGRPAVTPWIWETAQAEAEAGRPGWPDRVRERLQRDRVLQEMPDDERAALADAVIAHLVHGPPPERGGLPDRQALAGALLALIAVCLVALSLGMGNIDLARPDWDELWLASLPVSTQALFTARLAQYALLNVLAWLLVGPAVATLAIVGGARWPAGLAIGLAAAAGWALAAAAVRLAAETWLRQHLAQARIKNLQALLTVVGMAAMVAVYAVAMGFGPLPAWFLGLAAAAPWQLLPTGWAAVAALDPARAAWLAPAGLAVAGLLAVTAVRACAAWSRHGLVAHDGTMAGARGGAARAWRALGVLGKDLLLLRRDRALLVQALIVPLFMIALQLVLNPQVGRSALSGFHAATTFAIALGGWVLMSAGQALAHEGQALWILGGAPRPLAALLRGKVAMWAGFACAYAACALAVIAIALPWPGASALSDIAMIAAGLPLLAVIAVGLGAAATDPQTTVPNRRVGIGAMYIYMLVMGLFSLAHNLGSAHQRLAMLAMLAVLAWALWQRLRDRLPWIFEPSERPPRTIDLADGAWAAFAFLVLQALIALALVAAGADATTAAVVAFGGAGAITATGAGLLLWRARLPALASALGLLPPRGAAGRAIVVGLGGGALAAVTAAGYLALLSALAPLLPGVQAALDEARQGQAAADGWRLVLLAVVLAPLCEEFIFRGLLFRGLRRDLTPWAAAAASAAVFAIIHPSLGVVPVFVLGVACALAYERTGWLLAPVLAHALYNGALLLSAGG